MSSGYKENYLIVIKEEQKWLIPRISYSFKSTWAYLESEVIIMGPKNNKKSHDSFNFSKCNYTG